MFERRGFIKLFYNSIVKRDLYILTETPLSAIAGKRNNSTTLGIEANGKP